MKHDKKKYLKKTVMVTASTMLAMNSVLASPLLWNVSAAEETRVTQESKIARTSIVKATAKSQMASDPIDKSLDGNASTYTDSNYTDTSFTMPQIYTFELDNTKKLSKVRILPRSDSTNGRVASYEVLVSTDGSVYTPVKTGTADPTSKAWIEIPFDVPVEAKFVQLKLRATEENFNSFHVVTTAEVELYEQVTFAEADKTELQKLYNECKDFKPVYNTETSGITKAFQSALENAEAVIKDETATQETVTSAINKLKNRYGLMITSEYTYHYSLANKNGEFTNKYVNFNEYTTDSLRALVDVYFASRNHMNTNFDRPQDTEQLYAWHAQFVEAEKNLVKVDTDHTYGQMIGLNPYAASGTRRGVFTVTEKPITDADGNKKIRLHVTYENNGLDPITQTDVTGKGKWKSSELKNFTVYMEYEKYGGESGRKSVTLEDTNAYDGLAFDIDVEPGIYSFELYASGGTKSATAGYYHTNVIENDTEAPKIVDREWSTRHSTNDPVVVTLTFSEPISKLVEKVDGKPTGHEWKKIDDVTYQREYTENARYNIYYEDLAGNPCKSEELLIVDNYFKDPLVKDVYFTGVHVDNGSHVEIELNAKPYNIADPNGEYVFKDGKHLLILDEEALATNDYYDTMCLWGNDNRDSKPEYDYPATWSYIYRDENGKLSVGRIDSVDKPEVILTVGDKEYNLNENPGAFGDPFVLPEAGVLGEPITVSVKAPYIDDYRNKKPVTTVQLTGTGEGKTAGDVATNHQSAQLKLVSQDGTTKSGTYCLSITYNYSNEKVATYYVKVNYKKAEVNKDQLAFQIGLAEKSIANEHWYKHNEAWENMLKAYKKAVEVYNDKNATQTAVDEAKKELATSLMYIRIEADAPVFSGVVDGGIYNHDVTYDVYDQSLDAIVIDGVRYDDPADAPRTITTEGKHVITAMDEDKGLPGLHKETTVTFVIDKTKPVVEVFDEKGNTVGSTYEMTLHVGDEYIEYGAYVKDNLDGEHKLSDPTAIYFVGADGKEIAVDAVDTSKVGEYRLEYQFSDQAGNQQTATRTVKIIEADVPVDPQEPSDPNKPIKPVDPVKPQKPEAPKDEINTGDVTNIAGILVLLLVSGVGLVVLRKKSHQ